MMNKTAAYLILVCLVSGVIVINSCKKDPVLPTLTTSAITNVTINSLTSGGVITKDGGAAITARGVCWSQVADPSITEEHTTDDKGIGSFVSNITGLTPNTLYHMRAYATNSAGTAYGEDVSVTTTPIVIPVLATTAITSIGLTTGISGGSITTDGNAVITAKGVCWATTSTPTLANSFTTDGTGNGSFTSLISGLTPATTYYVRAYATNIAGTAYGNELSFTTTEIVVPTLTTTMATSITLTTAIAGGNISNDGGGTIISKGTCWATTENPTVSDSKTSDGTGTGSFISNLAGLVAGTTYHIRAYATNSAGTAYGEDFSFSTSPISIPTITTAAATSITLTSAITGGNITVDGGGPVTARGVCWATAANPTVSGSKTADGTGTGSYISNITGLLPGVLYHIRAYATNSAGTAYGNDLTFTTTPVSIPSLSTSAVTSIALTTAVSGGNIISDGGGPVTLRGICWATTSGPTTASSKTSDGTGSGSFTSNLASLSPATTYYVRAYATNSAGTAYGNEISFTTSQVVIPTLTTASITSIALTTAVSGGNITANGGGAVTARGVCWATTVGPTTSNFTTSDGTGSGVYTSNITGLTPGTTYHVRAYAVNSAGTSYGNDLTFTTNPVVLPTVTTATATSIGLTTAVSGGTISSDGGGTITARGTCWATTTNPTIVNPKTSDGTGPGVFTSNLTGLTAGTTYHIRAYATNSAGTAYGNDLTFTTATAVPTITTTAATLITQTTAVAGGNIVTDNGASVTVRGTCWSTSANPTITDLHTSNGTGTGVFTSNLTGLTAGTTYHIRAYATNSAGTAYGSDMSFTTTATIPTITTTNTTSITLTTAISGGNITSNGGATVTASGLCWSTLANPTISDSHTSDGSVSGTFSSTMTGLTKGTAYYVRAYATNSTGTGYGNQLTFGTMIDDVDGNTYKTTFIGSQLWMAENLKTTLYSGGGSIPYVTDPASWASLLTPAYCWFNNNEATFKPLYGALYNWFAVNTGNLCPTGWHVPTDGEFSTMELTLGMSASVINNLGFRGTDQGSQIKSATGWSAGENGTNTSGFSGLPGGYRYGVDGTYQALGQWTYWWASDAGNGTETWYRRVDGSSTQVWRASVIYQGGKYVRCLKN